MAHTKIDFLYCINTKDVSLQKLIGALFFKQYEVLRQCY